MQQATCRGVVTSICSDLFCCELKLIIDVGVDCVMCNKCELTRKKVRTTVYLLLSVHDMFDMFICPNIVINRTIDSIVCWRNYDESGN